MIETFDTLRPPTSQELREIHDDAMKAVARDLPSPFEILSSLASPSRNALERAYTAQDSENRGCKRVRTQDIHLIFPKGLCDAHGYLGALGLAVHRELMAVRQ